MNWINRWFSKSVSPIKRKVRYRSFRPVLETLEDRRVLTPVAPTLLSPSGPTPPTASFSWVADPDASYYNFQITDVNTNQTIQGPNLTQTSLTLGSPLNLGDTYRWSVESIDSSGNIGPWTTNTIEVTYLTAATPIGPTGPAIPQPLFSWYALPNATHYDIYVQNQNNGVVLRNTDVIGTSWTPDTALAQGNTYLWWVRGIDSNNVAGPWSGSLPFSESVLPAPTLIGPSNTAVPQSTFSWNLVTGADHYDIWIQDQTTNQVIRNTNVPGTSWVSTTPLNTQDNYTWWVRAVNPQGYNGQWSTSLSFTAYALPAPTLVSPIGSSIDMPTFSWNPVTGADHYDIWVQDVNTGEIQRDQNVSGTAWVPETTLSPGDNYEWWVRAIDSSNNIGIWSSGQNFTAYVLPAPSLIGPTGSSATLPTFSWNPVTGADHYDIWVQDQKTGLIIRNQTVPGTTWVPSSPLIQGDSYVWWVRAINSAESAGSWSSSQTFSVNMLATPILISPTGTSGAAPTLTWNSVIGADHYDVWLQDNSTGVIQRNQSVMGTNWVPTSSLTPGDNYTWWVRAIDSVNSPGPWSSSLSFVAYVLPAPILIGPSGLSTTLPTFTWNAVIGADHYDIWVNDLTTGQGMVIRNQDVVGTSWTSTTALNPGDTYRWWVRALTSGNGNSAWSSSLVFTVTVSV